MEKFKALLTGHSMDFWGNSKPKCPHCGDDYDIGENEAYHLYDDDESHDVECPACDKLFTVVTSVRYTFHTDEQDIEE